MFFWYFNMDFFLVINIWKGKFTSVSQMLSQNHIFNIYHHPNQTHTQSVDGLNVGEHIINRIRSLNDVTKNNCIRRLWTLNKTIAKTEASKQILSVCKSYGFIPKFILDIGNRQRTNTSQLWTHIPWFPTKIIGLSHLVPRSKNTEHGQRFRQMFTSIKDIQGYSNRCL